MGPSDVDFSRVGPTTFVFSIVTTTGMSMKTTGLAAAPFFLSLAAFFGAFSGDSNGTITFPFLAEILH